MEMNRANLDSSLTGWAPRDESALADFKTQPCRNTLECSKLSECELSLRGLAEGVPHTDTAKLKQARKAIAGKHGEERRRRLIRSMRKTKSTMIHKHQQTTRFATLQIVTLSSDMLVVLQSMASNFISWKVI